MDIYVIFGWGPKLNGAMMAFANIDKAKKYVKESGGRWFGPAKYSVRIAPYAVIKVGE